MNPNPSAPPLDQLFAHATHPDTLANAWAHILARRAGPGIDRVTVDEFARDAAARLEALHHGLQQGSWTPLPALRISLAHDPHRPIAVATVRDRIVQRAMAVTLSRAWDAHIADHVYAYRPGRSVQQALRAVHDALDAGYTTWARTDLRHFFDRIDRTLLRHTLRNAGIDPRFIHLVDQLVHAGALASGALLQDDTGIPQGSALSPVLSNLYLAPFDNCIEDTHATVIRYADDLLVLADTPARAREVMERLEAAAAERKLSLNARKTRLGDAREGFRFLGMRFEPTGQAVPDVSTTHLHQRLSELALHNPEDARLLLDEWRAWYGPLPAEAAQDLRVLLALTRDACHDSSTHDATEALERLARLGRRRAWLQAASGDTATSLEEGIALVHAWNHALEQAARLAQEDSHSPAREDAQASLREALLRDVATLLRRDDAPIANLAELLGLDPPDLEACTRHEDHPLVPLHKALRDANRGQLAAAAHAVLHAPPCVDPPPAEASTLDAVDDELLLGLATLWLGDEAFTEQRDQRGHYGFGPATGNTLRALRRHLAGERRMGVALTPRPGMTRIVTLDVSPRHRPDPGNVDAHDDARALLEEVRRVRLDLRQRALRWCLRVAGIARERQLDVLVEEAPRDRMRLWFLLQEPIPALRAARFVRRLATRAGALDSDLRLVAQPPPEQGRRSMGLVLPLPLGRCPRTGTWSRLLDPHGEALVGGIRRLESTTPILPENVDEVLGDRTTGTTTVDSSDQPPDTPGTLSIALRDAPRASAVLQGCAILGAIGRKVDRIGAIDADERASLFEVLGHLPDPEGTEVLQALMAPIGLSEARVRKRVVTLPPLPLGCRKLHNRHPRHIPGDGCNGCDGGTTTPPARAGTPATPPAYPSPLMHAVGVRGWCPLRRNGAWHTASTQRHETTRKRILQHRSPAPGKATGPTDRNAPDAATLAHRTAPHDAPPSAAARPTAAPAVEASPAPTPMDHGILLLTDPAPTPCEQGLVASPPLSAPPPTGEPSTEPPPDSAPPLALEPQPATGPATPDAEGLLGEVMNLRRRLGETALKLQHAEKTLARLFEQQGVTRIRVSTGWLVYHPGKTPAFVLELS